MNVEAGGAARGVGVDRRLRVAGAARGDAPRPSSGHVELEVKGCPAVPTAAVRRVVGIEIGDLLLETSAGDGGRTSTG